LNTPLAVDIETVGENWEEFDEDTQEYLRTRGKSNKTEEEAKDKLALSPGTGKIIAIGMWKPEEGKGGLLLESDEASSEWTNFKENSVIHKGPEEHILRKFWEYIDSSSIGTLVTYNGRSFDGPFLMLRSAMYGITPTRTFLGYRYDFSDHCDLGEVISGFRARRMESLDFWCRRTGVGSPKDDIDGSDVGRVYEEGGIDRIGEYCLRDARCTGQLYQKLQPMIKKMN